MQRIWTAVLCGVALLWCPGILGTQVNNRRPITCNRAVIEAVRIEGCRREPCRVVKGEEVPVEIDVTFQAPRSTSDVELKAFAPYWNVPGTGDFGSNLVDEKSCSGLRIRPCPAVSDKRLTLKASIYADPELRKTVGVENGGDNAQGEVISAWALKFQGRHEGRSSDCSFSVRLNLVDDHPDQGGLLQRLQKLENKP